MVGFILSQEGQAILRDNGLQPLTPPRVDYPQRLPLSLQPLVKATRKEDSVLR